MSDHLTLVEGTICQRSGHLPKQVPYHTALIHNGEAIALIRAWQRVKLRLGRGA